MSDENAWNLLILSFCESNAVSEIKISEKESMIDENKINSCLKWDFVNSECDHHNSSKKIMNLTLN